jgi:hypothetical protein
MGERGMNRMLFVVVLAGCGPKAIAQGPRPADDLPAQVVWDFERAVKAGQDETLALFDFAAVGEVEILMHRYDALGRLPEISDDRRAEYLAEDGTPYPAERERTNIGKYYGFLIRPAIGRGGCQPARPTWKYNRLLDHYPPLPAGNESHEALREVVNAYFADGNGGVVGIRCAGGNRGLALVYTRRDNERGYDLITIYDDGP